VIQSNWAGNPVQQAWTGTDGVQQLISQSVKKHIQFTSTRNGGDNDWVTTACDSTMTVDGQCPAEGTTGVSTSKYSPSYFDSSMVIVVDNWGYLNGDVNAGPPKPGCAFSITNFKVTMSGTSPNPPNPPTSCNQQCAFQGSSATCAARVAWCTGGADRCGCTGYCTRAEAVTIVDGQCSGQCLC